MFEFASFRIDNVNLLASEATLFIIKFNNRYVVYNVNRNRFVQSTPLSATGRTIADIVNDESVNIWFDRVSTYRVASPVSRITYVEAVRLSRDRHDMHAAMRNVLLPVSWHSRDMDYSTRYDVQQRATNVVSSMCMRLDPNHGFVVDHPHASFKNSNGLRSTAFMNMRAKFKLFGHMIAHIKAGGTDKDINDVREWFFELANRYGDDSSRSVRRAYDAASQLSDLEITHCDCGHYESDENTHSVGSAGDTWCDSCFDEDAVYVEDQDEYWPRDDAYWSDRDDCYYSYDHDNDEDEDEDDDDYDREEASQPIMSYSTNILNVLDITSGIKSSHFGEFTLGIELEMSSGDSPCESSAESVRSRLGSSYCIIKHDGSLPHNGFEIVTMPHGLATHIEKFKAWEIDPTYRAWNTGKCGMHVHIDARAFTQMTLGKFLMFINSAGNTDFIRKIAGRHPLVDDQARTYCAAESQDVLVNPKQAVKGKSGERYRMVNMQNLGYDQARRLGLSSDNSYNGKYNTVELRIFRASLKKERLLAQIEFTHAAVMFCRVASWRDLNGTSFIKWLRSVAGQYPALVKWYGVRNVHTSTPTVIAPAEATCTDAVPPPVSPDYRHAHDQDHGYQLVIPHDNGFGISNYAGNNHLYFTYFRCASLQLQLAVFPYSGDESRIGDDDVIYVHDIVDNVWRLQEDDFNAIIREHNPVPATLNVSV
jgi:hypothetical protein